MSVLTTNWYKFDMPLALLISCRIGQPVNGRTLYFLLIAERS